MGAFLFDYDYAICGRFGRVATFLNVVALTPEAVQLPVPGIHEAAEGAVRTRV